MRVLIVENSAERQSLFARRIEGFSSSDKEMLDLKVKLVNEREFVGRLSEADVVIIGPGLAEQATALARQARVEAPWLQILMFVSDEAYGGGAFRTAYAVGVRKVFPEGSAPLDLLQELVAIHSDLRNEGRTYEGRIVAVVHAKGGVGATSLAAALGEVCDTNNRRTLLWDLDVETRDLSRALTVGGPEAKIVSGWVNGSREINREVFRDALVPISNSVSVLTPPDRFAESMDLVCHADGMEIANRIVDLSRVLFDVVIIDTAGRLGPAVGGLLRSADVILLVSDASELGITALDILLSSVKPLLGGGDRVRFLINPLSEEPVNLKELAADFDAIHHFPKAAWSLPVVPYDKKAGSWPGSGATLFGQGGKDCKAELEDIARKLQLIHGSLEEKPSGATRGWLQRILGRGPGQ